MSFSAIAAMSLGETGWLALALVASETWSVSQPASSTLAVISATEAKSARASGREIKTNPTACRTLMREPQFVWRVIRPANRTRRDGLCQLTPQRYALKPLIKILTSGSSGRNPSGDHEAVGP